MEAKYQRIKIIGKGAFGKAYLVRNSEADALCVVKQMDTGAMESKERQEAVKEALVLKKLLHPNIIQFQEVFMTRKGRLCIVMEYADGGDLHSAVQKQDGELFAEEKIVEWFAQICFALLHVHDRKVLHRDLKTQNIFLMASGQIKLGDFGIARVLATMQGFAKTMVGTPYYLSPEIIQERDYDYKSDVWSCGIVLYEMATLQHPFEAENLVLLAGKIVRDEIPEPDEKYSQDFRSLIHSMLKKEAKDRPSIREILHNSFLLPTMNECNEKFSLGLNLEEFSKAAEEADEEKGVPSPSGRPPTAVAASECADGFSDYSGSSSGDEADEAKQPEIALSRSVKSLKITEEEDAAGPSSLRAKADRLRDYLTGQTSEDTLDQACKLVRSEGAQGEKLQEEAAEVLGGPEKSKLLLPMVQLLCFLEDLAASALKESILDKFKKWDINKDGVITPSELSQVLRTLGMEEETIDKTFIAMDANKDGKIDYTEFVSWLYAEEETQVQVEE